MVRDSSKVQLTIKKHIILIKSAKKYEKKGKIRKSKKKIMPRRKNLLLKSNLKRNLLQADTLNYLGFTTRKLGDFKKGEEFYLQGLKIEPKSQRY